MLGKVIDPIAAHDERYFLSEKQIETILDRLVPLVAKPEDHGFFRGVIYLKLKESNSSTAAAFVANMLKTAKENNA